MKIFFKERSKTFWILVLHVIKLILPKPGIIMGIFAFLVLNINNANSQVTVAGSNGANGTYTKLQLAFTAINAQANQTGKNIVITISANTTETASAVLNGNATSWTSLIIYPTSTVTISGNLATPLIDLNSADNVTIDGRIGATGSTKSLTISNTSVSASASTSTIRFRADAISNTIKYCIVKGSEKVATSGVVFFSTATTTGNMGNLIDNNDITNAGSNRPYNAIFSEGSASKLNCRNTFSNNNIYDFFNVAGGDSYGIYLRNYTSECIITGNSFYETTSLVPAGSSLRYYNMVYINYTAGSAGVNFTITNNYFGGSAPFCMGVNAMRIGTSATILNKFSFISIYAGTAKPTTIDGNVMRNISFGSSEAEWFRAIEAWAGIIYIGTKSGNSIGDNTSNGSILLNGSCVSGRGFGIYIKSEDTVRVNNNIIGSITTTNPISTNACSFYGIYSQLSNGLVFANANTIGSTTVSNSIQTTSLSTAYPQYLFGFLNVGYGIQNFSDNIIANLTNFTTNPISTSQGAVAGMWLRNGITTATDNNIFNLTIANANTDATANGSVFGIACDDNSKFNPKVITGNTIYNLSNSYPTFSGIVAGLYIEGNTTGPNIVSRNFIHSLFVKGGSSTSASIYGIKIGSAKTCYTNNIINLGGDSRTTLYGIYESGIAGENNSLYFNSVYIGGKPPSESTNPSYALYSAANANTRDIRSNIFDNSRSTSSKSGLHYAAYFNYSSASNLTLNYNDYFASGNGGVAGYFNSADVHSVPLISGKDANSICSDPKFINPGSTNSADYMIGNSVEGEMAGSVIEDFGYNTRTNPNMGAWELQSPLPVELVSYDANCDNGRVEITWTTATETNNDYFTIEMKSETSNWSEVSRIDGAGNSNEVIFYSQLLEPNQAHYFRLKQTDFDGQEKFYDPIYIDCGLNESSKDFLIYPNPAKDFIKIVCPSNLEKSVILVHDIHGKLLIKQQCEAIENKLDIGFLSKGVYVVNVWGEGLNRSKLFIKE